MRKKMSLVLVALMMSISLAACSTGDSYSSNKNEMSQVAAEQTEAETEAETEENEKTSDEDGKTSSVEEDSDSSEENEEASKEESKEDEETSASNYEAIITEVTLSTSGKIDTTDMFSERDLTQNADLSEAEYIEVSDGQDISITSEGVYVISGSSQETTIYVETEDENAKVQLVLDGVSITNTSSPAIYVKSADKVFVTTTEKESRLAVTGTFEVDGDTNLDAVIFSKDTVVVNGLGILNITSSDNGITSKDTLKVTGGTLNLDVCGSGLEAHDAIEIAAGTINITNSNDGIHAEDNDDDTTGYIFIAGGMITINAADDAIHGTTIVQIDGGDINLVGAECIEGTYIQVNDGAINIEASDDGINAASKSSAYTPTFEMNGGEVTINMGAGDTDGVDSNGDIYVNGGVLDITGQSTFDYDGTAQYNGGSIIENGTETNTITNQFMGGGPGGGFGGGHGGGDFGGDFGGGGFGGGPH